MPLPLGKVSPYELAQLIFPEIESRTEDVLVGPDVGLDASVIEYKDGVLALSSDPITGAILNPGWLAVHVNANDVAAMGATPQWFLANIFLPRNAEKKEIKSLIEEAEKACEELGLSLVGGHTEVTPGIERVLISGAMVGTAGLDEWVSASGAEPGDKIILTKSAAVEGTFIIAHDREEELKSNIDTEIVESAKKFKEKLSVVRDALTANASGDVHAMHDVTEGGLVGGLYELADASKVGFSIQSESIPIPRETEIICDYFGLDPLRTISSGALLIAVRASDSKVIRKALDSENIPAAEIGIVLGDEKNRKMDGESLGFPQQDELWRIF